MPHGRPATWVARLFTEPRGHPLHASILSNATSKLCELVLELDIKPSKPTSSLESKILESPAKDALRDGI